MFHENFCDKQVYIYCSGKSGSSCLYETFRKIYKTSQIHSADCFRKLINNYDNKSSYNDNIFDYIDYSCKLYDDVYFIDSYRMPLERSISSFFQGIDKIEPCYLSKSIEYLIDLYNNHHYLNEDYYSIDEIMQHFGLIDFTSHELVFFHNNHYIHKTIVVNNSTRVHIILLKFNYINGWSKILSDIFNTNIEIISSNLGEVKEYKEIYKSFKKNYKIKQNIIKHFIDDNHFLKYNTPNEQELYIETLKSKL